MQHLARRRLRTHAAAVFTAGLLSAAGAHAQIAATSPASPAPTAAREPPMRASVGLVLGLGGLFPSEFTDVAARFGYRNGFFIGNVALEGALHLTPNLSLGTRLGYTGGSTGERRADRTGIGLGIFDAGAFIRLGAPVFQQRNARLFVGVQLEGGVGVASQWLRGEGASSGYLPRLGGALVLQMQGEGFGSGIRLGYQHMHWPAGNGQDRDLGLSGMYVAWTFEVGR